MMCITYARDRCSAVLGSARRINIVTTRESRHSPSIGYIGTLLAMLMLRFLPLLGQKCACLSIKIFLVLFDYCSLVCFEVSCILYCLEH